MTRPPACRSRLHFTAYWGLGPDNAMRRKAFAGWRPAAVVDLNDQPQAVRHALRTAPSTGIKAIDCIYISCVYIHQYDTSIARPKNIARRRGRAGRGLQRLEQPPGGAPDHPVC